MLLSDADAKRISTDTRVEGRASQELQHWELLTSQCHYLHYTYRNYFSQS